MKTCSTFLFIAAFACAGLFHPMTATAGCPGKTVVITRPACPPPVVRCIPRPVQRAGGRPVVMPVRPGCQPGIGCAPAMGPGRAGGGNWGAIQTVVRQHGYILVPRGNGNHELRPVQNRRR